jgi:hypothetical protein
MAIWPTSKVKYGSEFKRDWVSYTMYIGSALSITLIVAITGDTKATMQYDRYEKLIIIERGVDLINWPSGVPFVTASDIGSFHTLRHLLTALILDDADKRCKWVTLSQEDWDKRQAAYYQAESKAAPKTRKQKDCMQTEPSVDASQSNDGSEVDSAEVVQPKKRQRGKKNDKQQDKENVSTTTSGKITKSKGKDGQAGAGSKDKAASRRALARASKANGKINTASNQNADPPLALVNS